MARITTINENEWLVVTVCGRLNFLSHSALEKPCKEAKDGIKHVIFDFGLLNYISGEGLSLIEKINQDLEKRSISLSIRNANDKLKRLFRRTKFDEIIDVSYKEESNNTLQKNSNKKRNFVLFSIFIVLNLVYLVWRACCTLPFHWGVVPLVLGIILLLFEALGAFESFIHYSSINNTNAPALPTVPDDAFPGVDIFIATYSESPELVYKTVNACKWLDYPDKSKVHIYVCDDGRRPEMRALAKELGVNYFDRPDNKGAKAGNLNAALARTNSPLIVTFDADMIPQHSFLLKTVPYFLEKDKKVGFVQTPQSFYNPDLFQANLFAENYLPNEQDYFYKVIEVSRNKSNSVIYGGSNTVISRAALNDVGGFYTGTITEDFATGILIEEKGYTCYGTGETLASGVAVDNLPGLITQRIRWGRGCIATGRKLHIITTKKLNLSQKLHYWASIFYWYGPFKKLAYLLAPILYGVFGVILLDCSISGILVFWLPKFIIDTVVQRRFSSNIRSLHWSSLYETMLFPFMLIPTLLETMGISLKKFKVTKKDTGAGGSNFPYLIPFLVLLFFSICGIFNILNFMILFSEIYPLIVFFWLIYNSSQLIMVLFFVLGEKLYKEHVAVKAKVNGKLCINNSEKNTSVEFLCESVGFSEGHLLVKFKNHDDRVLLKMIKESSDIKLKFAYGRYRSVLVVSSLQRVRMALKDKAAGDNEENTSYYSFKIISFAENKNEYYQMLYDRPPAMPEKLGSFWDNFKIFIWSIRHEASELSFAYRKHIIIFLSVVVAALAGSLITKDYFLHKGIEKTIEMRIGWNLGNSLDAWGAGQRLIETPIQDETYWGNPVIKESLIRSVRKAGFDTIRIPVTWRDHLEKGKIDALWLNRVKQVIDYAYKNHFYVIINVMHDDFLPTDDAPTMISSAETRFRQLWLDISLAFAGYDSHLVFESINEPRLIGTSEEWTTGTREAQERVNRLNAIFVETVRKTGGENALRLLIIPGYGTNSGSAALKAIKIPPNAGNIAVAVHIYSPRPFAIELNNITTWNKENPKDTAELDQIFADAKRLFTDKKIPVIFTEIGAGDKHNEDARAAWTAYVVEKCSKQKIVPIWWDNGNSGPNDINFALFDRNTGKPLFNKIIAALIGQY